MTFVGMVGFVIDITAPVFGRSIVIVNELPDDGVNADSESPRREAT